jgi:nucleoid DNA-binding protein
MVYSALVSRIAQETGIDEEDVRKVLGIFPEIVMEGDEGEQTRTPLGVFTIVRRRQKAVRTPDGVWSSAPERIHAKLKPGKKLQRDLNESSSSDEAETD